MSNAGDSLRVPQYRRHKPSGQAVVTLNGRDIYLGKWNTKASRAEYDRLIGEWLAGGRRRPHSKGAVTVAELCLAYWRHASRYYTRGTGNTGEVYAIKSALRIIDHGHRPWF